tara:strand:+ start:11785 stop:12624 length:840 start_codon:yes stop_codon:yes gene_type:complete
MKNLTLENFKTNGAAWPFELPEYKNNDILKEKYFEFQKKAEKYKGATVSLKPNLLSTFFHKLSVNPNIISNVKKIIGDDIYIWSSAFFAKAPGQGKIVSYHQDNPYWQLSTTNVVTAWIAITNSDKNSGALEVVPKSHNLGLIKKLDVENPRKAYLKGEKTTPEKDLLSYNQNLNEFIKKNKPLPIELKPGQYSIHHVNTVHGSGINNSSDWRIGYAIRYVSSDTKHLEEKSDTAIHVCGKKNDYFTDEKMPSNDFDNAAVLEYDKSMGSAGAFGNKKY